MAGTAGPFIQVHVGPEDRRIWINAGYIVGIYPATDDPTGASIEMADNENLVYVRESMDDVAAMANGSVAPEQRPMST